VAGTKYRGQLEERMKTIMTELMESQNSIIFIDELHTLVGCGFGRTLTRCGEHFEAGAVAR
jgi:ATP-dependent Clp protease ATP-binding subunit ClpA